MKSAFWACLWSPCWPGYRANIVGALGISGITDTTVAIGAVFFCSPCPRATAWRFAGLERFDPHAVGRVVAVWRRVCAGGGISDSGLSNWIGAQLSVVAAAPLVVILLCLVALIVFLTEITSNTATTTTFLPVIAALALEMSQPPLMLIIPATLAASCAFMFRWQPAQCHCFRVGAGKHRQYGARRVLDKPDWCRCVDPVGALSCAAHPVGLTGAVQSACNSSQDYRQLCCSAPGFLTGGTRGDAAG